MAQDEYRVEYPCDGVKEILVHVAGPLACFPGEEGKLVVAGNPYVEIRQQDGEPPRLLVNDVVGAGDYADAGKRPAGARPAPANGEHNITTIIYVPSNRLVGVYRASTYEATLGNGYLIYSYRHLSENSHIAPFPQPGERQ